MSQRSQDIEALARLAARLAGRDPDEHIALTLAGVVVFDDVAWRYPDFLARAEIAYEALADGRLLCSGELNGRKAALAHGEGVADEGGKPAA